MNKEIILNIVMIVLTISVTQWFYWYIKRFEKKHGKPKSLSVTAKYLHEKGNWILFYLFIFLGLVVPIGWIMGLGLTSIACGILGLIGIWTGYNVKIKNKFQHTWHIVFVLTASLIYFVGLCLISLYFLPFIVVFLGWALIIALKKVDCFTTKIEKVLILMVQVIAVIVGIVIPLIN